MKIVKGPHRTSHLRYLARAEASFVPGRRVARATRYRVEMSFFGLARYGSDDERPAWSDTSSEDDSDAIGDDDEGVGPSSTGVAAPAAAPEPKTVLPSADDVFGAVKGPPAFLRPEATRPLASAHRNPTADGDGDGAEDRVGDDVDDASRKRRAVASATVSSAPKRYREDDIRARESALAGVEDVGDERRRSGTERGRPRDALAMAMLGVPQRKNTEPARAMDPAEFLAKGSGRALMPRKKGGLERMEHEKKKRQSGQNGRDSVEWKSEAEMVLRQQYD